MYGMYILGGGFRYLLLYPYLGEMIQFDEHIFQMGWNHQLVFIYWLHFKNQLFM